MIVSHLFQSEDRVFSLDIPYDWLQAGYVGHDTDKDLTWVAMVDHDRGIALAFVVRNLRSVTPEVIHLDPVASAVKENDHGKVDDNPRP